MPQTARTGAKRPATKFSSPRDPHRGGTLLGLFVGLALGLLIALGVAWYLRQAPLPFENKYQPPAKPAGADTAGAPKVLPPPGKAAGAEGEDKPRFDFYGILEGKQPASAPESKPATPLPLPLPAPSLPAPGVPTATAPSGASDAAKEVLYLQVGAFQKQADADNMRAKLSLLGFEAEVQQAEIPDKGTLHRVRTGPYTSPAEMNKARTVLAEQGIQAALVKGRTQ